ncbi:MAG TPA: cytochrome c oxidase subunit 3 [Candidatus Acidoferrum sp.]
MSSASTVNSHAVTLPASSRPLASTVVAATSADRASRSGIWLGLFTITMSFAAFTSALFVREGTTDWGHIVLPSILYFNTFLLLCSSGTIEISRRYLSGGRLIDTQESRKGSVWLLFTLALGLAFCVGQYMAWQQLRAQGLYLATNPNSSFFYVLTFMHVLHLLAGIAVLAYLTGRVLASHSTFRRSLFDNAAIYWHFLGILWVYLFALCLMKL